MSPPPAGSPGPEIAPGHPAFEHARTSGGGAVLWPLTLRGAVDVGMLRQALATAAGRRGAGDVEWDAADLRQSTGEERDAELRRLGARTLERPFDAPGAPLLRALLLRTGEDTHALLLALHHVVSDGWSVRVLRDELATLYGELARAGEAEEE
jgi:hypothetical protein